MQVQMQQRLGWTPPLEQQQQGPSSHAMHSPQRAASQQSRQQQRDAEAYRQRQQNSPEKGYSTAQQLAADIERQDQQRGQRGGGYDQRGSPLRGDSKALVGGDGGGFGSAAGSGGGRAGSGGRPGGGAQAEADANRYWQQEQQQLPRQEQQQLPRQQQRGVRLPGQMYQTTAQATQAAVWERRKAQMQQPSGGGGSIQAGRPAHVRAGVAPGQRAGITTGPAALGYEQNFRYEKGGVQPQPVHTSPYESAADPYRKSDETFADGPGWKHEIISNQPQRAFDAAAREGVAAGGGGQSEFGRRPAVLSSDYTSYMQQQFAQSPSPSQWDKRAPMAPFVPPPYPAGQGVGILERREHEAEANEVLKAKTAASMKDMIGRQQQEDYGLFRHATDAELLAYRKTDASHRGSRAEQHSLPRQVSQRQMERNRMAR